MTQLTISGSGPLTRSTASMLDQMLCSLSGLSSGIGFVMRSPLDPKVVVAGGEMTGVHVIRNLPPPKPGAYHIGGTGIFVEEAVIRALGETAERYAHIMSWVGERHETIFASLREMHEANRRVMVVEGLRYFSEEQLSRPAFPFVAADVDSQICWVRASSLIEGASVWLPAQEALIGYRGRANEPHYMGAVTTGGAAHTKAVLALRNALLELVQIDSAMGHWYGRGKAHLMKASERTRNIASIVERSLSASVGVPRFYWLPNPDLPAITIACAIQSEELPRFCVGLGCDLKLERAMYRAYLEGVAVCQLARVILFREANENSVQGETTEIYDLDSNVALYARLGADAVREKFEDVPSLDPADIPEDVKLRDDKEDVRFLAEGFSAGGKDLAVLDLTTEDLYDLGFRVLRVWSPDVLCLSLPSAPPELHSRFRAYGGFHNADCHPYP